MFVLSYRNYILKSLLYIDRSLSFPDYNHVGVLCDLLSSEDFDPVDETDEILIGKGLDCRRLYFEQYGVWPREGPCTMFEMMAGLAISCDEMLSPAPSETTPWMFFKYMLDCICSYGNIEESCRHYRTELLGDADGWNIDIWTQCNHMPWSAIL